VIEVRGVSGEVRRGYRVVARLRSWHLDGHQKLSATATDVDGFLVEDGGPYAVVLDVGKRQWVWPTVEVSTFTPAVVARVDGPPQVRE
jgi:hypothetical protein